MNNDLIRLNINGHVLIKDDIGITHLDQYNAIHPQNFSRIIARALANESNDYIYRMAFGNGGAIVDAVYDVTLKTPNDGITPDTAGWTSRLYNEVYTEIINEDNGGSPNTVNSIVSMKDTTNPLQSKVVVTVVLGPNEPRIQSTTDNISPTDTTSDYFKFDEIGLYSPGKSNEAKPGYSFIDFGTSAEGTDDTGLLPSTEYIINISVDDVDVLSPSYTTYSITTDLGTTTIDDLVVLLNDQLVGCTASFVGGNIILTSGTTGDASNVIVQPFDELLSSPVPSNYLLDVDNLTSFTGSITTTYGSDVGYEEYYSNQVKERERLLTHITFVPIIKTSNRTFYITYTITINVSPTIM